MSDKPSAAQPSVPAMPLGLAVVPIVALIAFLSVNIFKFGGDPHVPLVLAAAVAALIGWWKGHSWTAIEEGMIEGIRIGLKAVLILVIIGALIGTWILSGVVPIMIVYGLKLLSPEWFLVAACVICSVVSIATGSSWTTAGTVGVALIGVGGALGVPLPMAAGAIISGAYFGDKMSPLSDTTNLAPAVAGSELFEHIRHMVYTTVPALLIALVLYALLGLTLEGGQTDTSNVEAIRQTIGNAFDLNPLLLLPPLLVVFMVIYRIPALPALVGGALLGGLLALVFQDASLGSVAAVAHYGYVSETGNPAVDELLSRGGMDGMMGTVLLILCALSFGGIMERTGMLAVLAHSILKLARSTGSLIATTVATCIGMNIVAPDQYLSLVVPGRMYRSAYEARGLHAKNLSRTLEDAGTLSSPLVAWNTCGAFMFGALAVSPWQYAPFAFFNLLTPVIAIVLGYTGWTIARAEPKPAPQIRSQESNTV